MNDEDPKPIYNVLFLCTGNSARSIMAECILNRVGHGRFRAFSAGSHPTGAVDPFALDLLKRRNHPVDELRSKDWEEFAQPGSPDLHFVFTVCDRAAGEVCPVWPGQPMTAHWGLPDPAEVEGNDTERHVAFANVYRELTTRLEIFVSLPIEQLDRLALERKLREMGRRRETAQA